MMALLIGLYLWAAATSWVLMAMVCADTFERLNTVKWVLAGLLWPLLVPALTWKILFDPKDPFTG